MSVSVALNILLSAVLCTCFAADAPIQPKKPQLTAEQAKDALLRFIRANPKAFIGEPNPDKLAEIPLEAQGETGYSLGAFEFDLAQPSYFAALCVEGPEPYFYSGAFTQHDGRWTATAPKLQRVHK
jgi:hypothetical protein